VSESICEHRAICRAAFQPYADPAAPCWREARALVEACTLLEPQDECGHPRLFIRTGDPDGLGCTNYCLRCHEEAQTKGER
jgi:hypothetical protein